MKHTELNQLIKEEIKKVLKEEATFDKIKRLFQRTPIEVKLLNSLDVYELLNPGDEKFNIVIQAAKQLGMNIDKTKASELIQKKLSMEIEDLENET